MSTSNFRKMTWGIIVWNLFGISTCYASEATRGRTDATPAATASMVSGEDAGKNPEGAQADASTSRGILSGLADQIYVIIEDERIKTLTEIDKQRLATLDDLTQERLAASEDLGEGLNRTLEALLAERSKAFIELEAMGNRITERTIVSSRQLIDHFFIRLAQFTAGVFLLAGLLGLFLFRMKNRGKS